MRDRIEVANELHELVKELALKMDEAKAYGLDVSFSINLNEKGKFMPTLRVTSVILDT